MGDNNDFEPTVAAAVAATLGDAFTEGEDSSACTVSKQEMMKGFTELLVTLGVHPAMRAAAAASPDEWYSSAAHEALSGPE